MFNGAIKIQFYSEMSALAMILHSVRKRICTVKRDL